MNCLLFAAKIGIVRRLCVPGCSSAWLERLVWDQEAAGSNPVTPTAFRQVNRRYIYLLFRSHRSLHLLFTTNGSNTLAFNRGKNQSRRKVKVERGTEQQNFLLRSTFHSPISNRTTKSESKSLSTTLSTKHEIGRKFVERNGIKSISQNASKTLFRGVLSGFQGQECEPLKTAQKWRRGDLNPCPETFPVRLLRT